MIVFHERHRVPHEVFRMTEERVNDDSRLRPFDLVDFHRLIFNRKVPVKDPDPAFTGKRYRKPAFSNSIHRGAADRYIEGYLWRQFCRHIHLGRYDLAVPRDKQYVVKREALIINKLFFGSLFCHLYCLRILIYVWGFRSSFVLSCHP